MAEAPFHVPTSMMTRGRTPERSFSKIGIGAVPALQVQRIRRGIKAGIGVFLVDHAALAANNHVLQGCFASTPILHTIQLPTIGGALLRKIENKSAQNRIAFREFVWDTSVCSPS